MTHKEAVEAMSCMRDFSGMRKVIKRIGNGAVDFGDNCWYVDYVENSPMLTSGGRIISTNREGSLGECRIYPLYQARMQKEKEREEQNHKEKIQKTRKTMQHYLGDYSGTAMSIKERKLAGTPPMGRSKEQHTLIQNLNRKKR